MGTTTLILGGGWGGLTAAHHLRGLISAEHEIRIVERSTEFSLGVSNLSLVTGERTAEQVRRPMANLKRSGIEWIHAEVQAIDPTVRSVETNRGTLEADYLVLALGAALAPHATPGFDAAHNLYDPDGAHAIGEELEQFDAGRLVVLVAGTPFRCPAAPYEAAMLVEALLRGKGLRPKVEVALYTPEGIPMAVAGPAVGEALKDLMFKRGIEAHFGHQITEIDGTTQTIRFDEESTTYDLLIAIPPHEAPAPIREAGLTDATGYVPVHPQTLELLSDVDSLEVQHPGVFALGDVAAVRLVNQMLLPKAGVFAEGQALVVSESIAAEINGVAKPRAYDGHGFCYVDVGDGLAAYGSGDFYAYPGPRVTLEEPSEEGRRAKAQYEQLLDTWFD